MNRSDPQTRRDEADASEANARNAEAIVELDELSLCTDEGHRDNRYAEIVLTGPEDSATTDAEKDRKFLNRVM